MFAGAHENQTILEVTTKGSDKDHDNDNGSSNDNTIH